MNLTANNSSFFFTARDLWSNSSTVVIWESRVDVLSVILVWWYSFGYLQWIEFSFDHWNNSKFLSFTGFHHILVIGFIFFLMNDLAAAWHFNSPSLSKVSLQKGMVFRSRKDHLILHQFYDWSVHSTFSSIQHRLQHSFHLIPHNLCIYRLTDAFIPVFCKAVLHFNVLESNQIYPCEWISSQCLTQIEPLMGTKID